MAVLLGDLHDIANHFANLDSFFIHICKFTLDYYIRLITSDSKNKNDILHNSITLLSLIFDVEYRKIY